MLTNFHHYFFFLIKQERARLLRGQSVQQVGPQGLLYVQQRELAVTSPKDGRLGSRELGIIPEGNWIFYFISFLNRLHLHSGFWWCHHLSHCGPEAHRYDEREKETVTQIDPTFGTISVSTRVSCVHWKPDSAQLFSSLHGISLLPWSQWVGRGA